MKPRGAPLEHSAPRARRLALLLGALAIAHGALILANGSLLAIGSAATSA